MRVGRWSTTAANNNAAVPDGAPEGWSPPNFNNVVREIMAAVKAMADEVEWSDLISTPSGDWPTITRDTTTQFTVNGTDFTTDFTANRRVRVVGATTAEGHVTTSTFTGGNTEVVVVWDTSTAAGGVLVADCPTSPTQAWLAPKALGDAAYFNEGAGNGLDADTVDGQEAAALSSNIGKNKIINGRFGVWQRNTTFTDPTDVYTADRMKTSVDGGNATVSAQSFTLGQTDVPNEPEFYYRHNQTVAGTNPYWLTRIEGVRTFAGQQATFSYYAKMDSALSVTASIAQNFGTGGSPSTEVSVTTSAETITTSWVRYSVTATLTSISGKTLGSAGNDYVELKLALPSGAGFVFDLADVQFELGGSASDIDQRTFAYEWRECRRHFRKTFPYATVPAASAGIEGALITSGVGNQKEDLSYTWSFEPEMHAAPTTTLYNFGAAGTAWRGVGTGTAEASTAINGSTSGVLIQATTAPNDDDSYGIHATAEAEL